MQCYNCDETTDLKEWKFPEKIVACKACCEYFRKCSTRGCSVDVDLNVTGYKILCEKVVCYYCVKDGNLPKQLENQKIKKNVKLEDKLKKTYRKKK